MEANRVPGRNERVVAAFTVAGCFALALACGKVDDSVSAQPGGAGGAGFAASVSGGAGGSVGSTEPLGDLAQSYEQLAVEILGGFGPALCPKGEATRFEVTRVPGRLAWVGCFNSENPGEVMMSDRLLSAAEADSVSQALAKVRVSLAEDCVAGLPRLTLDVTTVLGVGLYSDDSDSACPGDAQAGRTFVTGLRELGDQLTRLSVR